MNDVIYTQDPQLKKRLWAQFRAMFGLAERRRRWDVDKDIPWEAASANTSPAVAAIVESFCAVELYLPDYVAKAVPLFRKNRAWCWSLINWGYEESKHSLALGDWLVRSGHRTEEYMSDLENRLYEHEWDLPQDSATGMLIYAMVQELATWLHYRNLRSCLRKEDDPCLWTLLNFVQIDERTHHTFYKELVRVFLEVDRQGTIESLRRVLGSFGMPAIDLIAPSRQVLADVRAMNIYSEEIFYRDVYLVVLEDLGISRHEFRPPRAAKKSQVPTAQA
jgi:acyl-[acyl-carrier-protein] desaturase